MHFTNKIIVPFNVLFSCSIFTADSPHTQREKKCAYSREWYRNMPFEQKKARQERERLYNTTADEKRQKEPLKEGEMSCVPTLYTRVPLPWETLWIFMSLHLHNHGNAFY
jgi:hypothetical protein